MKVIRHGTSIFMALVENREEKAYLSQKREEQQEWIPLYLSDQSTPFAEMHVRTYHVRLHENLLIGTAIQAFLFNQAHSDETNDRKSSRH
jgi:hypothetical protein